MIDVHSPMKSGRLARILAYDRLLIHTCRLIHQGPMTLLAD
jgi:hypothetical protein